MRTSVVQQGMLLPITLVLLLLLTIIGTAGMRSSSLQENISSNLREEAISFQAAEAALNVAEQQALMLELNGKILECHVLSPEKTPDICQGTLDNLSESASSSIKPSHYTIQLIATITASTETGRPLDNDGFLIRIKSTGYGLSGTKDKPTSQSVLQSTYLVEN